MSTAHKRGRLARSLVLAVTLAGTSLALLPASSAQAVTPPVTAGTASWGISTYLNSANPGRPNPYPAGYVAPSTFDPSTRISTWGAATGTVADDGSATLSFKGTSVNFAPTSGAWLKLAEPQATLDPSGNGTLTALVSYGMAPGTNPVPYNDSTPTRPATRVAVLTLAGNVTADRVNAPGTVTWTGLDSTFTAAFKDYLDGDATATPAIAPWPYYTTFTAAADRQPSPLSITASTKRASTVLASFNKEPKANRPGKFAVLVSGSEGLPTGAVTVTAARNGKVKSATTGTLANGAVLLTLPKFKPGAWTLTTKYVGDGGYAAAEDTTTVKVAKKRKKK